MPTFYLDTSALVKCYVPERGTAWTLSLVAHDPFLATPQNQIITSLLALAEGGAALARRQRTGEITAAQRMDLFDRLV
jgi:predicted nucleic acid-binding protein